MRPSTLIELCGFGLITYTAYQWHQLVGLLVGGLFLILIGYATEDQAAVVALTRPLQAVRNRMGRSKARRRAKKAG